MTSNRKGHRDNGTHSSFTLSYKDLGLLQSLLNLSVLILYYTYSSLLSYAQDGQLGQDGIHKSASIPRVPKMSVVSLYSSAQSAVGFLSTTLSGIVYILPDHNTVRILQLCLGLAPCADRYPILVPLDASRCLSNGLLHLQNTQRLALHHLYNKTSTRG